MRNLVFLQTGAPLVVHVVFPPAPPRVFPEWGFVDTMARYGPSPYVGPSGLLRASRRRPRPGPRWRPGQVPAQ
ncbi:hypothetical protein GCM10012276_28080 [Nocardioides deserti]|nr:hypothetical protein GCM10012276_28080 [Nocardioides deserti]